MRQVGLSLDILAGPIWVVEYGEMLPGHLLPATFLSATLSTEAVENSTILRSRLFIRSESLL